MEKLITNFQMELDMDYNDTMNKMKNEKEPKELKKYEKKLNLISNLKKYNITYLNLRKLESVIKTDDETAKWKPRDLAVTRLLMVNRATNRGTIRAPAAATPPWQVHK